MSQGQPSPRNTPIELAATTLPRLLSAVGSLIADICGGVHKVHRRKISVNNKIGPKNGLYFVSTISNLFMQFFSICYCNNDNFFTSHFCPVSHVLLFLIVDIKYLFQSFTLASSIDMISQ